MVTKIWANVVRLKDENITAVAHQKQFILGYVGKAPSSTASYSLQPLVRFPSTSSMF